MKVARSSFYLRRALWIFVAWVVFAMGIFFYDYITLKSQDALPASYNLKSAFIAYLIVAVSAGVIGGTLTVNLMEYWLRKYRFWVALVLIVCIYTLVSIFVGALGSLYIRSAQMELSMFDASMLRELPSFFGKTIFIKNYVVWLVLVLLTLIFLMVNDRFGPGVFPEYLKGKYFHPKKEQRIFMFSDIKDATAIAEQLGEGRYFHFLKDFFKTISPAIEMHRGAVYQYVGDEIVVTWKMKTASFNQNSLLCFYEMLRLVHEKAAYFEGVYGFQPHFKTGYHCGPTVVGELGVMKREIAFSGDTLNTAARIQGKCNDLGVSVLASESFVTSLGQLPQGILEVPLGPHLLKGKQQALVLHTFRNEN